MNVETKSVAGVTYETNSTKGEFIADVAIFGNVDAVLDRILAGAFDKAIENDPPPPVYYAHKWEIPPIGETIDWAANDKSLRVKSRLFVDGGDAHPYASMVYAGMKSRDGRVPALREFSFTYGVPDGGATQVMLEGKSVRDLSEIRPVAEIGPCPMGVNPDTRLVSPPKGMGLVLPTNGSVIEHLESLLVQLEAENDEAKAEAWERLDRFHKSLQVKSSDALPTVTPELAHILTMRASH